LYFLKIVSGQQWSSLTQRNKILKALETQEGLVSGTNTFWVLGFVVNMNNIENHQPYHLKWKEYLNTFIYLIVSSFWEQMQNYKM